MRTSFMLGIAALIFFNLGCDSKDQPPQMQDFSCIKLFDESGQGLGLHGSCTSSDDWGKITLNASELAFLNFSDTVSLTGTTAGTITHFGIAPSPVRINDALRVFVGISSGSPLKLKIAIVDESFNVVQQVAAKVLNGLALQMDPSKYESGKYYRMYYRVSATGAATLYEGYGNFLVCKTFIDGVNTTIESDCM